MMDIPAPQPTMPKPTAPRDATPAENPKTGAGRLKPEPHLVSPIAMLWITAALENGAIKYGPYNWRDTPIPTNTYVSAMKRHLDEYATGVDRASDSRVPHLAHIAAGCIILMDAEAKGTLIDDRFRIDGFEEVLREVQALKAGWVQAR
ncbi:dATP/dGTP diphosphohydrolase domain-containing protein [Methylobacterium sp. NPDC080182]|uniref:dATP/dGTP diphosphohydrolase domain-containing protein n=1 Tax=Methylobacterium sp. NPDC080182 TaxID=3390590 RepID=UPI003D020A2A